MFKSLVYLSILTAATVASWIGFSVHHNYTTSTIDDATKIRITPIPEEFDRETIEKINSKKKISANLEDDRSTITITITPSQESPAEGTPSAEVEL